MALITLDRVGVLAPPDGQSLAAVTQWLLADLCSPGTPVALPGAPDGGDSVPTVRARLDAAYAAVFRTPAAWGLALVVGVHTGTMAVEGGARRHVHQAALYTDGAGVFGAPAFSGPFTTDTPPQGADLARAVQGLSALRLKAAGVVAPTMRVYSVVGAGARLDALLWDAALCGCVVARLADYAATVGVDVLVAPAGGHAWAGALVPLVRVPLVLLGAEEHGPACLADRRSALVVDSVASDSVAAAARLVRRASPAIAVHGVALVRGAGPCDLLALDSMHVMF
jgi:hypothetical protein